MSEIKATENFYHYGSIIWTPAKKFSVQKDILSYSWEDCISKFVPPPIIRAYI